MLWIHHLLAALLIYFSFVYLTSVILYILKQIKSTNFI